MPNLSRLPVARQESYEWQYEGACSGVDVEQFFSPESERGARRADREDAAKAFCHRCPVVEQCLRHALQVREPYGVWGGLNTGEREEILAGRTATPDRVAHAA